MVSLMIFNRGQSQILQEWSNPIFPSYSLSKTNAARYPLRLRLLSVCLARVVLCIAVFSSSCFPLPSSLSGNRVHGTESESALLHFLFASVKTVLLHNHFAFHLTPILCAGKCRYVLDRTIDSSCVGVTKQAYPVKQRLGLYRIDSSRDPVALVFYNKVSPFTVRHE